MAECRSRQERILTAAWEAVQAAIQGTGFPVAEARKPEACGQCHLGPDHPQIEIYNESKHGAIYNAEARRMELDYR